MNIKKYIPNLITLANLTCGLLALTFVFSGLYELTLIFVVLGVFFDFFDGFFARLFNVTGDLGKQLDSLADMVTSGVVPGVVMVSMLTVAYDLDFGEIQNANKVTLFLPYIGFVLTLAACYRLAKFNVDTRQTSSFIGLPTPAMSLFIVSLPVIQLYTEYDFIENLLDNHYFLIAVTLLLSYLMNAEISLFSLKFKNYKWKENSFKYLLIISSLVLLITLNLVAIPVIILTYILLSVVNNSFSKK